ncbi:MFS transporter [Streptomyces sp. H10-C2]|uniref:MDR family MFS transporter n=1 Tax=unclassified Streptomyces TaxID=2593676 RepID=UPI0024B89E2B|nr:MULTISPECIES: MFS transporter [unclassified Streptomyces]MDJ0346675.1 MFS transporter [Streptomyces sp. PH10-H1]MDJ0373899.1 MFS transporter [Streptomyces sp. H10-C2]
MSGLPRAFWWLWTSTLINRLGAFVVTFLALYLTVERGFSASYAGLVAALYGLGGSFGAVGGGVLADRIGRRTTMLIAQLGAAVATAALGFTDSAFTIAAVACVVGMTSNASRPALQAMMADLVPAEDRVRAFSLNYWAINIGFGVSSAAAGLIAAEGYVWLFLGSAFMTVMCALVIYAKVPETLPSTDSARETEKNDGTGTGLTDVLRDRRFMSLVGLTFLLGTVTQQGSTTLSVDMGQSGYSAKEYGLVIGLNGLIIVLLQIPVTRMMRGRSQAGLLAAGTLLMGWGFGLTAFAGSVGFYALTVTVWTLGEIMHAPASMSAVAELSPAQARGRYQGMFSLSWSAASFVGPLAGGFALDHWGSGVAWGSCAVVGTIAAVGYGTLLRTRSAPTPVPAAGSSPLAGRAEEQPVRRAGRQG